MSLKLQLNKKNGAVIGTASACLLALLLYANHLDGKTSHIAPQSAATAPSPPPVILPDPESKKAAPPSKLDTRDHSCELSGLCFKDGEHEILLSSL